MIGFDKVQFEYSAESNTPGFRLEVPNITILKGEAVAVIGPSGCGKTTMLRLAGGISIPTSGEVTFQGVGLSTRSESQRRNLRLRRVGFIFQEFRLLDYLDVLQNILLPYRLGSLKLDTEARNRARELAGELGIGKLLRRSIHRLSHGERQRVAICRALVTRPACLLADEPTGNLDPVNKRGILDALLDAARNHEAAVLAVTHDHELLPSFDRVIDFGKEEQES